MFLQYHNLQSLVLFLNKEPVVFMKESTRNLQFLESLLIGFWFLDNTIVSKVGIFWDFENRGYKFEKPPW